ncbi:Fc.00g024470.m01.CDS01 [Cosmosporella sp. VM-42]
MKRLVDKFKSRRESRDGGRLQKRRPDVNQDIDDFLTADSSKHVVDSSESVPRPGPMPAPSPISNTSVSTKVNNDDDVGTFSGFDGWLSSFTPNPHDANIVEMPAPQAHAEELVLYGFPQEDYLNLTLYGVKKPSHANKFTIKILGPWYMTLKQVTQLLKEHGYEEPVSAKHASSSISNWSPDEALPQDFQILAHEGPSCYDIDADSGLLINKDEPLDHFTDTLRHLKVRCKDDRVVATSFPAQLDIAFNRTLRLPEDGKLHDQPAGLGRIPVMNIASISKKLQNSRNDSLIDMAKKGGVFFPLYQREAMFISFKAAVGSFAVRTFVGGVNAVSGLPWNAPPSKRSSKQDYISVPPQKFLDGIAVGQDTVKQFIAMPLGSGYSVEKQVTGKEDVGGIQVEIVPGNQWRVIPQTRGPTAPYDTPRSMQIDVVILNCASPELKEDTTLEALNATDWINQHRPIYMRHLYNSQVTAYPSYQYHQAGATPNSLPWRPDSDVSMTAVYRMDLTLSYTENGRPRTVAVQWSPWWKLEQCFHERSQAMFKIEGKDFNQRTFRLLYNGVPLGPASLQEQGVEENSIIQVLDHANPYAYQYSQQGQQPQQHGCARPPATEYQAPSPGAYYSPPSTNNSPVPPPPQQEYVRPTTNQYQASSPGAYYSPPSTGSAPLPQRMSAGGGYGSSPSTAVATPGSQTNRPYNNISPTSALPPDRSGGYSAVIPAPRMSVPQKPTPQMASHASPPPSYAPSSPSAVSSGAAYSPSDYSAPVYSPLDYASIQPQQQQPPQQQMRPPTSAASSLPPSRASVPQPRPQPTDQTGWAMGIAAGSRIRQIIHKDPFSVATWCKARATMLSVQILNSVAFETLTGMLAPPSPITPQMYLKQGLPFFASYGEGTTTDGGHNLVNVKSVGELDADGENIQLGSSLSSSTKIGCTFCGRMLCDSILRPCNHTFCSTCITGYMAYHNTVVCRICNAHATKLIGFSAPMALPGEDLVDLSDAKVITIEPYKGMSAFHSMYELDGQPQAMYVQPTLYELSG